MTELAIELQNRIYEWDPGFDLTGIQTEQLQLFYENLIRWNEVMNLTAITEIHEVYEKHFLDSASILKAVNRKDLTGKSYGNPVRLIDVGTGAGFPGMVLAILFPGCDVTLMDSLRKRVDFLKDTVQFTGLQNVTCIHSRAEELARDQQHREQYDYAVSRAVANIATLSEYCLPFVKTGGSFIAYKSEKAEEELKESGRAIQTLGGRVERQVKFTLPGTDYARVLLDIRKCKPTDGKYPRKSGIPSKSPLH